MTLKVKHFPLMIYLTWSSLLGWNRDKTYNVQTNVLVMREIKVF